MDAVLYNAVGVDATFYTAVRDAALRTAVGMGAALYTSIDMLSLIHI